MISKEEAKRALDKIIKKSRVHLYKPIQIAEILYYQRTIEDIDLLNLQSYRNRSKKWRDEICKVLLGRTSSSSQKYQDDLFNDNAIPPVILNELGKENLITNGAVEAYIYTHFLNKHHQLSNALNYCLNATTNSFHLEIFLSLFREQSGLKRSIDKIYEIIVYSLFSLLVEILEIRIQVLVNSERVDILKEFNDFGKKVMSLDFDNPTYIQEARVYRVGITNAADRGLDMYSNWGPVIQIKHLSLDESLAEEIVTSISSDRIVIVCKDADKGVILSLLNQIGWKSKIQSVVTEIDLISWYEKALRGKYCKSLGENLLKRLSQEISREFPSLNQIPDLLKKRHYEMINDLFWVQSESEESHE